MVMGFDDIMLALAKRGPVITEGNKCLEVIVMDLVLQLEVGTLNRMELIEPLANKTIPEIPVVRQCRIRRRDHFADHELFVDKTLEYLQMDDWLLELLEEIEALGAFQDQSNIVSA